MALDRDGGRLLCQAFFVVYTWRMDRIDHMDSKSVQPGETPGFSARMQAVFWQHNIFLKRCFE